MAANLGRDGAIKSGPESTWGTSVSRTVTHELTSFTGFYGKQKMKARASLNQPAAFERAFYFVGIDCMGSMETECTYENMGVFWYAALGANGSSGPGPYTHTYTCDTSIPSYTLEPIRGSAANSTLVLGAMITKLALSWAPDECLKLKTDWIARSSNAVAAAGSPSYGTGRSVVCAYQLGTVTINSVNYALRSCTITLDNNLQKRPISGSQYTSEPYLGTRSVMVEMEIEYDTTVAEAPYTANLAGTQYDTTFTFTGSGNNTLVVNIYNAAFEDVGMDVPNVNMLTQKLRLKAYTNGTNHAIRVVVTNDNSSAISG